MSCLLGSVTALGDFDAHLRGRKTSKQNLQCVLCRLGRCELSGVFQIAIQIASFGIMVLYPVMGMEAASITTSHGSFKYLKTPSPNCVYDIIYNSACSDT